jgi:hypothetical protein
MMPSQNVDSQMMMARILSGGPPIEESDGAFPLDWLLLLHQSGTNRGVFFPHPPIIIMPPQYFQKILLQINEQFRLSISKKSPNKSYLKSHIISPSIPHNFSPSIHI